MFLLSGLCEGLVEVGFLLLIGRVLGLWPSGCGFKRLTEGCSGRGFPGRLMRGLFSVSPLGMIVMSVPARRDGAVGRCVSSADTSLSLSLSLVPVALLV